MVTAEAWEQGQQVLAPGIQMGEPRSRPPEGLVEGPDFRQAVDRGG